MGEPAYKGIGFRNFVSCLRQLRGDAAVAATLAAVDPELGRQLREELLFSGNWYPLAWFRELHRAAQQVTGAGPELARQIGYGTVKNDLAGVYRIFVLVASPQFLIGRAPRLFANYFDHGRLTVLESDALTAHARWTGCAGFDANVWSDVLGGCVAALEAAGAREVRLDVTRGGRDGDAEMELTAGWKVV